MGGARLYVASHDLDDLQKDKVLISEAFTLRAKDFALHCLMWGRY